MTVRGGRRAMVDDSDSTSSCLNPEALNLIQGSGLGLGFRIEEDS